jgi:hypothetical protein
MERGVQGLTFGSLLGFFVNVIVDHRESVFLATANEMVENKV